MNPVEETIVNEEVEEVEEEEEPTIEPVEQVLVRGMDVSSHQPTDLTALIQQYQVEHIVVKLYLPGESIAPSHSIKQLQSAVENNCSVSGYLWAYPEFDPRQSVQDALAVAEATGVILSILWIDCETYGDVGNPNHDGPSEDWILAAINECHIHSIRGGIYSGLWWLEGYLKHWSRLTQFPLWLAEYSGIQDLESVNLPAGWNPEKLLGHQFSADGIDLNVFDKRVTVL